MGGTGRTRADESHGGGQAGVRRDSTSRDHLLYLREVRKHGMPARYVGSRDRVKAKLHSNGFFCKVGGSMQKMSIYWEKHGSHVVSKLLVQAFISSAVWKKDKNALQRLGRNNGKQHTDM